MHNKIKALILEQYPELEDYKVIDDNEDIAYISTRLEEEGLITFTIVYRLDGSCTGESWLQTEYYSEKLKKVIIMDYNFPQWIDSEPNLTALDKFIGFLVNEQKEVDQLEASICICQAQHHTS